MQLYPIDTGKGVKRNENVVFIIIQLTITVETESWKSRKKILLQLMSLFSLSIVERLFINNANRFSSL